MRHRGWTWRRGNELVCSAAQLLLVNEIYRVLDLLNARLKPKPHSNPSNCRQTAGASKVFFFKAEPCFDSSGAYAKRF